MGYEAHIVRLNDNEKVEVDIFKSMTRSYKMQIEMAWNGVSSCFEGEKSYDEEDSNDSNEGDDGNSDDDEESDSRRQLATQTYIAYSCDVFDFGATFSDKLKVRSDVGITTSTTWGSIKDIAMRDDFRESSWFVSLILI